MSISYFSVLSSINYSHIPSLFLCTLQKENISGQLFSIFHELTHLSATDILVSALEHSMNLFALFVIRISSCSILFKLLEFESGSFECLVFSEVIALCFIVWQYIDCLCFCTEKYFCEWKLTISFYPIRQ